LAAERNYNNCVATVAAIFQEPLSSLNPAFTVGDQISEVLRTIGD
jgi:ABC-type dipeptide/oligopeptide/nickel transport system ATPase component